MPIGNHPPDTAATGIWLGFLALIAGALALDLGVFHRAPRRMGAREALAWTAVWMGLALAFGGFVYLAYRGHWAGLGARVDRTDSRLNDGRTAAVKYLTAYALEQSLSVDNIFVISVLLGSFGIPAIHRHRVLFWGIAGAVVLRGAMIGLGAAIISRAHWILDVFGLFLVATAVRMLRSGSRRPDPAGNRWIRLACGLLQEPDRLHGGRLIVPRGPGASGGAGPAIAYVLTPLAVALIAIEAADLLFAVDSLPAVFSVTADPFLVFTSNIFAVLGMRSLFFALDGLEERFRHLRPALALVLAVVGAKMLLGAWLARKLGAAMDLELLALIVAILAAGVAASWSAPRGRKRTG